MLGKVEPEWPQFSFLVNSNSIVVLERAKNIQGAQTHLWGSINTVPRLTSFFSFALASPPLRTSSAHHTSPSDVCHCTKIYHAPKSAPAAFTGKEQHTASWPAMTGPNTAWWAALSNYWHPTTTLDHLCLCSTSMHSIACGESFAGAMQGCRTSTMLSQPSPSRR